MVTSKQHEDVLRDTIQNLRKAGYRVIDLERKCPDAIAIKVRDGKAEISAVEVLSEQHKIGKGFHRKWTYYAKKSVYHMFDKLIFSIFQRDKEGYKLEKIDTHGIVEREEI